MSKMTAKERGISAEDQRKCILLVLEHFGGWAMMSEILEHFDGAVMTPHVLSAQGRATLRTVVNREMVWAGFVTQAHGDDAMDAWTTSPVFGWAITEKGRAYLNSAPSTPSGGGGGGGQRRVVRAVRSKPKADPVATDIAMKAAQAARQRFFSGKHGMLMPHTHDADDVAQEAALRAWERAPRFDPQRGNAKQFAQVVARSTMQDLRRSAISRRVGAEDGGEVYEALAYGFDSEESVPMVPALWANSALDGVIVDEQETAGRETIARVFNAMKPKPRRAIKRWLSRGAEGSQDKRPNETRLKDALLCARKVAREVFTEVAA